MEVRSFDTRFAVFIIFFFPFCVHAQVKDNNAWINVISDECIYNNNNHAAFTSLEEWNGNLMVAFREAGAHRATPTDKGIIRVMKQTKNEWKPQHTFKMEGEDLRDPDFLSFNNRLLLYTHGFFSEYKKSGWTELKPIKHNAPYNPSIWKKRVFRNVIYGIGNLGGKWPLLMKSRDGEQWEVVTEYRIGGNATEADMVFIDNIMYICIRIDTPVGSNSMWGESVYPFDKCKWTMMDISVASPEMILHSKKNILLVGREYDYHNSDFKSANRVSIFVIEKEGKVKKRFVVDQQSGDQGYASFSKSNDEYYYMSYYTGRKNTTIRMLTFKVNDHLLK